MEKVVIQCDDITYLMRYLFPITPESEEGDFDLFSLGDMVVSIQRNLTGNTAICVADVDRITISSGEGDAATARIVCVANYSSYDISMLSEPDGALLWQHSIRRPDPSWAPLSTYDLGHVAAGYASCIRDTQRLRLAGGDTLSSSEVMRAVKSGHRIDFVTKDLLGLGRVRNPVIGAVRTRARGVRVTFRDGRSVDLTTGHMLPVDTEVMAPPALGSGQADVDVRQQHTIVAGRVRPGMFLLDGVVDSVTSVGTIDAVRLWTHHPAWIHTADGLSIGTRWHEIMLGWAPVAESAEQGGILWPTAPVTGWLWDHTVRAPARGIFGAKVKSGGRQLILSDMANATNIRALLSERPDMAFGWAAEGIPARTRRDWCRGTTFTPRAMMRLLAGPEVVGDPVFAPDFLPLAA